VPDAPRQAAAALAAKQVELANQKSTAVALPAPAASPTGAASPTQYFHGARVAARGGPSCNVNRSIDETWRASASRGTTLLDEPPCAALSWAASLPGGQ
jgi:hypothetical protein